MTDCVAKRLTKRFITKCQLIYYFTKWYYTNPPLILCPWLQADMAALAIG